MLASMAKIVPKDIPVVDRKDHRMQLGTLLSNDDLVAKVIKTLEELNVMDHTYVIMAIILLRVCGWLVFVDHRFASL